MNRMMYVVKLWRQTGEDTWEEIQRFHADNNMQLVRIIDLLSSLLEYDREAKWKKIEIVVNQDG